MATTNAPMYDWDSRDNIKAHPDHILQHLLDENNDIDCTKITDFQGDEIADPSVSGLIYGSFVRRFLHGPGQNWLGRGDWSERMAIELNEWKKRNIPNTRLLCS